MVRSHSRNLRRGPLPHFRDEVIDDEELGGGCADTREGAGTGDGRGRDGGDGGAGGDGEVDGGDGGDDGDGDRRCAADAGRDGVGDGGDDGAVAAVDNDDDNGTACFLASREPISLQPSDAEL